MENQDVINKHLALAATGGDRGLAAMLLQTCVEESPKIIAQALEAISSEQFDAARRCGYSLRSSFAAVGAIAASERAGVLEKIPNQKLADFYNALTSVKNEFARVAQAAETCWQDRDAN
jgi:HPt (histidine-containing phosphotransfer) domain-containing protein